MGLPQLAHSWPARAQRVQDDDLSDDPLLDDFKLLRRRVFQWQGQAPRHLAMHATCIRLPGSSRCQPGKLQLYMHQACDPWPPAAGRLRQEGPRAHALGDRQVGQSRAVTGMRRAAMHCARRWLCRGLPCANPTPVPGCVRGACASEGRQRGADAGAARARADWAGVEPLRYLAPFLSRVPPKRAGFGELARRRRSSVAGEQRVTGYQYHSVAQPGQRWSSV